MIQLSNNKFDLEERTAKFAEEVIDFVKIIKINAVNQRIINQLVGSAGSVGANYCEATEGESKKDFVHKIGICKKEIKETQFWLRLLARSDSEEKEKIRIFRSYALLMCIWLILAKNEKLTKIQFSLTLAIF
ncbi:four helix bundle protein [Candidatus Kuenenbacteria bacterium]|nr:four helix bundle protein [Candidatus Kuenenbacteria bacterium]